MPFFLGAYLMMVGVLPAYFMTRAAGSRKPVGVVDLAGVVHVEEAKDHDRGVGVRPGPRARILLDRLASSSAQGRGITALLQEAQSNQADVPVGGQDAAVLEGGVPEDEGQSAGVRD